MNSLQIYDEEKQSYVLEHMGAVLRNFQIEKMVIDRYCLITTFSFIRQWHAVSTKILRNV